MHPDIDDIDVSKFIDPSEQIEIKKFDDIIPLIASCSIMITIDLSTTILEAQLLKKPVISVNTKKHPFGISTLFKTNACHNIDIDMLEDELKRIFSDADYRKKIILDGHDFVKKYVSNIGNSTQNIMKYLMNE